MNHLLSCGSHQTCLVKPHSNKLVCWGDNNHGQLDVPSQLAQLRDTDSKQLGGTSSASTPHINSRSRSIPSSTTPGSPQPVKSVIAGLGYSCALTLSNQLHCWGINRYNQCDIPDEYRTHVLSYSLGGLFTCVVRSDKSVKCFGDSKEGYSIVPNVLSTGVVKVYSGMNHTCVVKENGRMYCWGELIEQGFIKPFRADPDIKRVAITQNIQAVTGGNNVILQIIKSSDKFSHNSAINELMEKENENKIIYLDVNVQFKNQNDMSETACILDDKRSLNCQNTQQTYYNISTLFNSDTIAVSVGNGHFCSLNLKGQIRCMGNNKHNQTSIPDVLKLNTSYSKVSPGFNHLCTVKVTNYLSCAGNNSAGQTDVPIDQTEYTSAYKQSIGSGYNQSCALMHFKLGAVINCWGLEKDGILNIPEQVSQDHHYKKGKMKGNPILQNHNADSMQNQNNNLYQSSIMLSVGNRHACQVLFCWGWNKYGQLDILLLYNIIEKLGEDEQMKNQNVHPSNGGLDLDELMNDIKVKQVSAGGGHTCYFVEVKRDNKLECVGLNDDGQADVPGAFKLEVGMVMDIVNMGIVNRKINQITQYKSEEGGGRGGDDKIISIYPIYNPVEKFDKNYSIYHVSAGYKHTCCLVKKGEVGEINCWGRIEINGQTNQLYRNNQKANLINGAVDQHQNSIDLIDKNQEINDDEIESFNSFSNSNPNKQITSINSLNISELISDMPIEISSGRNHICIRSLKNSVYCSGLNKSGQLNIPGNLQSNVDSVDLNYDASCGVNNNGHIDCWGRLRWFN